MATVLLILDINGTLVDSTHQKRKAVNPDIRARHKYVYFRPGVREFLSFLAQHPHIRYAVWSSSITPNVQPIVSHLFADLPPPLFVWSREQCLKLPGPGYRTVKDLSQVWSRFPDWDHWNTYLIDDSSEKASAQPGCHIQIAEFKASPRSLKTDRALLSLQSRLQTEIPTSSIPSSYVPPPLTTTPSNVPTDGQSPSYTS